MNDSVPRAVRRGERPLGGHPHPQGKFSSSVLVAAIITAFMGGGIAIIVQSGWLLWLSVGVVLLGMPASWLVRVMRETAVAQKQPDARPPEASRVPAAGPGIRI